MSLILHLTIALSSIAYATYVLLSPSRSRLAVSWSLVALTLASGTYLVVSTHAPMLQSCMSGLLYTGFVSLGLFSAWRKLAAQEKTDRHD